jgi:5-formyltetrahydrofolate cyclo-ligase
MQTNLIAQKSSLRKLLKQALKQLTPEEKAHQSRTVTEYLLKKCEKFQAANHLAVYLAMEEEEINTIPLVEHFLASKSDSRHLYVPFVDMSNSAEQPMQFYELESLEQFKNEMNTNNKYRIRQFNDLTKVKLGNARLFDLILVPGLGFGQTTDKRISRLGRGKGYYDKFLRQIPACHTIGIGFNQQYLPLNPHLKQADIPVNEAYDVYLNEFLCESIINERSNNNNSNSN